MNYRRTQADSSILGLIKMNWEGVYRNTSWAILKFYPNTYRRDTLVSLTITKRTEPPRYLVFIYMEIEKNRTYLK